MKWLEDFSREAHFQLSDRELEALWSRGVSEDQIEAYQVGYVDQQLPVDVEFPTPFLNWWAEKPRDDVFVFPLTNALGHVEGVQLRHVDLERKGYTDYVASKEEPVYFGLHQAMPSVWETGAVCLVEGTFDLFPLQRHLPFVISTLHAGIPANLARLLRRLVHQIWLAYDTDFRGRQAVSQIYRKHGKEFDLRLLRIPEVPYRNRHVKDPGELWEVWGDERIGGYLRDPVGVIP